MSSAAKDPLRWVRNPVDFDAYAVAPDGRGVRVLYIQAGTAAGPGACIAEVSVAEDPAKVEITLVERDLAGTYPDGAVAARALAAVSGCLEVRLDSDLAGRAVVDGSSGRRASRIDPDDGGAEAAEARRLLNAGCPIWES